MCQWSPILEPPPVLFMFLNHTKWREAGVGCGCGGGGDSTLVVLSLNEVLKLNWLRKWLMCIMELRVALHKGVC